MLLLLLSLLLTMVQTSDHTPKQAPFCVHPKTGKVCVPIDPAQAWEFDPDEVPTVQQLAHELSAAAQQQQQQQGGAAAPAAAAGQDGAGGGAWRGTSLEQHVEFFTTSFLAPLTAASKAALNERAKKSAAADQQQRGGRSDVDVSW